MMKRPEFFDGETAEITPRSHPCTREVFGYIDWCCESIGSSSLSADKLSLPACGVISPQIPTSARVQTYVVRHRPSGVARGSVLLCGALGVERERSHRTLVELARSLSQEGFECYRFDFAGNGESGGRFDEHCLTSWRQQLEMLIERVQEQHANGPLVLWGVRAGALLASECFAAGLTDAAFLCAPMHGQALLDDAARRWLIAEMIAASHAGSTAGAQPTSKARRTSDVLQEGSAVSVDGYRWTPRLWSDADRHRVANPTSDESRLSRVIDLRAPRLNRGATANAAAAQLPAGLIECDRFWESSPLLVPRTAGLRDATLQFLELVAEQFAACRLDGQQRVRA